MYGQFVKMTLWTTDSAGSGSRKSGGEILQLMVACMACGIAPELPQTQVMDFLCSALGLSLQDFQHNIEKRLKVYILNCKHRRSRWMFSDDKYHGHAWTPVFMDWECGTCTKFTVLKVSSQAPGPQDDYLSLKTDSTNRTLFQWVKHYQVI